MVELDITCNLAEWSAGQIVPVLGAHLADLANPVEPRKRFGDLRADGRNLNEWRGDHADEKDVHHEAPQRHGAGENRAAADNDHYDSDQADDERTCGADERGGSERAGNVGEQLVDSLAEDPVFTLFRYVDLHDPDAPERFGKAPGDVGVQPTTVAEQGSEPRES